VDDCIFCRIVAGEIPSDVVYRDEYVTAFRDIEPMAPVHVLVIPNEHLASTDELEERHEAAMGRLLRAAGQIARDEGVAGHGYRLTINTGRNANQLVPHLHLHLMGGRPFGWPPG
jgi:histidine triad (HIT) family protein